MEREFESEFNLIDEKWIIVRHNDCRTEKVSLKDAILNASDYTELAGETKVQDIAILRLILAVMYTVFSRYDEKGNEIDISDDIDFPMDNWENMWKMKCIPKEPIEKYFEKWRDRFWLFDEKYPFYQSNAVKGKTEPVSTAKMIGTLYESGNKPRIFSDRTYEGRELEYDEAARWLVHLNGFDDIAAKKPTPKKTWNGKLGLIAIKGKNLFETIMLNYVADADAENEIYESCPSWEEDVSNEFNHIIAIPSNQAKLLTIMSRQLYLYRENDKVCGYYIAGGDYFEEEDIISEQMTIWRINKKENTFTPARHDRSKKAWQEFGSIAAFPNMQKQDNSSKGERTPGIIKWIQRLQKNEMLGKDHTVNILSAAVVYDYGQATSLPVIDYISDSISFHSQLLLNSGEKWRKIINDEIEKCEDAAKKVYSLSVNLQKAAGASGDDLNGSAAKEQFYNRIDGIFRRWLYGVDAGNDNYDEYCKKLEKELLSISRKFAEGLVKQTGSNSIFSRFTDKKGEITSSAKAINIYIAQIKKIFDKAGDNNE